MGDPGLECSGGKVRPLRKGDGYADSREVGRQGGNRGEQLMGRLGGGTALTAVGAVTWGQKPRGGADHVVCGSRKPCRSHSETHDLIDVIARCLWGGTAGYAADGSEAGSLGRKPLP